MVIQDLSLKTLNHVDIHCFHGLPISLIMLVYFLQDQVSNYKTSKNHRKMTRVNLEYTPHIKALTPSKRDSITIIKKGQSFCILKWVLFASEGLPAMPHMDLFAHHFSGER